MSGAPGCPQIIKAPDSGPGFPFDLYMQPLAEASLARVVGRPLLLLFPLVLRVRYGVEPEEPEVSAADRAAGEPDAEAGVWDVIIIGAGIAGLAAAGELIAVG